MSYYLRLAREHDERQPFVMQDILDALIEGHSCHSYRALSKHINDWCSHSMDYRKMVQVTPIVSHIFEEYKAWTLRTK